MLRTAFAVGLILVAGCVQSQKHNENSPIQRGVASTEAPNDFEPNRHHFGGTAKDTERELKLMRGILERSTTLGIATERRDLLEKNLFDTGVDPNGALDCKSTMAMGRDDFYLHHRTPDGTCYMHNQGPFLQKKNHESDLSNLKRMGAKGARFGRNSAPPTQAQIEEHERNLMDPNPVTVSKTFFSRKPEISPETDGFQPVPWVNLLASAWLQAENHDWFSHGKNVDMSHMDPKTQAQFAKAFEPYRVSGEDGSTFIIPRTMPDMSFLKGQMPGQTYAKDGKPSPYEKEGAKYGRKYRNAVTHWWDASHIYGSDAETVKRVRTVPSGLPNAGQIYPDGKIAVDEAQRKLYYRPDPNNDNEVLPITGFNDNWWLGLEMIHTIFALEHNKVAAHLKTQFEKGGRGPAFTMYNEVKNDPAKRSDFLFNKARLVVAALIAKIHTVEWTPALLDNPALRMGMYSNWHGSKTAVGDIESPTVRRWIEYMAGPGARMLISGLTGEGTLDFYKVPFTLTEEFVSVYRMHPLLSDKIDMMRHNSRGNSIENSVEIDKARDGDVEKVFTVDHPSFKSVDWMYSFGRNKAGLMTLHNYPKFMENMDIRRNIAGQKKDQPLKMNMGAVDILRDRERQTPRYNNFRRSLRMRPLLRFEELFVTSKVLYEDYTGKNEAYRKVIDKLRAMAKADKYHAGPDTVLPDGTVVKDGAMIERDHRKIPSFSVWNTTKNFFGLGFKGALDDGKKLVSEHVFYDYYFSLPVEEQQALLTPQEIQDVADMKRLYNNDVEKLDLLVGTLAEEDRYDFFGFGNTPFYIFALMASRRLMTDPFLSDLYTNDVYSPAGKEWVEKQSMVDVIVRNFPELKPKFVNVKNAFHPWNPN